MKVLVILNEKSGTLASSSTNDEQERIANGFRSAGVEADVRFIAPAKIKATAQAARDGSDPAGPFDAVVAGGGDGTLNTIAHVLAGGRAAFGVLPLGTHNHFAKELETPLDLDAAVAALARAIHDGAVEDMDVASVNGTIFLNFSGIGLHPQVVRARDVTHKHLRMSELLKAVMRRFLKIFSLGLAFLGSLRRLPVRRVVLTGGDPPRSIARVTPSVIVCNNPYQMQVFGLEGVSHPDRGMLNVYVARSKGPIGMVRLLLASMVKMLANLRDFEAISLPSVRISTRRRGRIPVSVDGEVLELETPLHYEVRAGGLRVIKPKGNAE